MKYLALAAAVLLAGCSVKPYVGFGLHAPSHDEPEFKGNADLGTIGFRGPTHSLEIMGLDFDMYWRCEHTSSFSIKEDGIGFNRCEGVFE